jgi:uncharacterized cupredoxin-like copper-binding protein
MREMDSIDARTPPRPHGGRGRLLLGQAALLLLLAGCGAPDRVPLQVVTQNFRFTPAALELRANQAVRFTLRDPDTVEHDFQVDGLTVMAGAMPADHVHEAGSVPVGFHVHAAAGASTTLTFTPTTRGTYTAYCTVPGHREAGMVATVTVR